MSNLLTEKDLIGMMRDAYKKRLHEVMSETDLLDNQGKVVVQKGLKVRHKESQYEYTVDSVMQGPDGKVAVKLRNPDVARMSPADSMDIMAEDDLVAPISQTHDAEGEMPVSPSKDSSEEISDDDVFVVDQAEFEKEYEVK
tara:strand:+ start:1038 stop:1460 length:423 start_codon:yes stop_codon:yes gene_type:complete